LPDSDFEHNDAENGEYDDPLPVLGTAEALYTFEGKCKNVVVFQVIP
jgi:hypothetical protein